MTKPDHPANYEAEHSYIHDQHEVFDQTPGGTSLTETYRDFRDLYLPNTPRTKHQSDCIIDGYERLDDRDLFGLAQARKDRAAGF